MGHDSQRWDVAPKKRIAICLMIGGIIAGLIVGYLTGSNVWALVGLAVSLGSYQMFAHADPADRRRRRK